MSALRRVQVAVLSVEEIEVQLLSKKLNSSFSKIHPAHLRKPKRHVSFPFFIFSVTTETQKSRDLRKALLHG